MDDTSSAAARHGARIQCLVSARYTRTPMNMNSRTCAKTRAARRDRRPQTELKISKAIQPWAFSCQRNLLRAATLLRMLYRDMCVLFSISFWRMFSLRELISNRLALKNPLRYFQSGGAVWISGFLSFGHNEKHLCIFSSKS